MLLCSGTAAPPKLFHEGSQAMRAAMNTLAVSFHHLFISSCSCPVQVIPNYSSRTQHSQWSTFPTLTEHSCLLLGASLVLTGHSKTTEVVQVGGRLGMVTLTSTSLMRGLVHATPARHTPAPSPQQSQQDDWAYNPFLRPLREVEGCFRTTSEPSDTVLGGSGGIRQEGGGRDR